MCGIVGIINRRDRVDERLLGRMTDRLAHRGPDASDLVVRGPLGFGHRRLRVIDLAGGAQPWADGQNLLVYNGEIYNFVQLRSELEEAGHRFESRSDTEVLAKAYRQWGAGALSRFNGMFAFGLWDGDGPNEGRLLLGRDRMGQKPLYYFQTDREFVFASELKALAVHPACPSQLSRPALVRYLMSEFVPAPWTIFDGVFKLEPSMAAWFDPKRWRLDVVRYWRLPFAQNAAQRPGSLREATDDLGRVLGDAVQRRLVSDVPLGVFLSGGLDSSTITGLMARHRPASRIETFCIGFSDATFDESAHAASVARFLGTNHHVERLDAHRVWDLLGHLSDLLDEPLGDASVVPTYLLSQFARQQVTVVLAGDGGDELFAGYPTFQADRLARILYQWQPALVRRFVEGAAERLPVSLDNISLDFKIKQFLKGMRVSGLSRHQVWLGSFAPWELAHLLTDDVLGQVDLDEPFFEMARRVADERPASWMDALMAFYVRYYLADDILVKVDRASMAVGLEARAPLLDPEVVELAARIPGSWRLHGLTTKYLLKRVASGLVPDAIVRRPKKGFGIPVGKWLLGPLGPLMDRVLARDRIEAQGLFRPEAVASLISDHRGRRRDNRKQLWTLMAFELWYDAYQ